MATQQRCLVLSNGVSLPRVGLGTFKAAGPDVSAAVQTALSVGIRHIDTASIYKNQELISKAVAASGLPRQEVFITSKISPYEQGSAKAAAACAAIRQQLGGSPVDLMLVHWPGASKTDASSPDNARLRLETWRVLEEQYRSGHVRAIGVSNYEVSHLQELLAVATVAPMVNQVEVHPRRPCVELRGLCAAHSIAVVAYASLGCGQLLAHPEVLRVARALGIPPAQVLLKWALQQGMAVIPKSVTPHRIMELSESALLGPDTPRLTAEHMAQLGALEDGHKYCWDASGIL